MTDPRVVWSRLTGFERRCALYAIGCWIGLVVAHYHEHRDTLAWAFACGLWFWVGRFAGDDPGILDDQGDARRPSGRLAAADALIAFEREHRYGLILESEIEEHEALEAAYDAALEGQ